MDKNIETVMHLKKKLDKGVSFEKTMHILYKLQKIPISIKLLEETQIGFKIRELSKTQKSNDIGKTAKLLTISWKEYVRNHQEDRTSSSPGGEESPGQARYEHDDRHRTRHSDDEKHNKKHKHHKTNKDQQSDSDVDEQIERKKLKKRHRDDLPSPSTSNNKSNKSLTVCDNDASKNSQVKRIRIKEPQQQQPEDMFSTLMGQMEEATLKSSRSIGGGGLTKVPVLRKLPPKTTQNGQFNHNEILASLQTDQQVMSSPDYRRNASQRVMDSDSFSSFDAGSNSKRSAETEQKFHIGMKFKGRSTVFAGSSKVLATVPKVYSLQDICIRKLMHHVDQIYEVGDLPFYLLKPVLLKCSVLQLRRIETYNPHLQEDSDDLWRAFCEHEFRGRHISETKYKTWRRFYQYLVDEREIKLKKITAGISSKARQAVPERTVQQIDLKMPREIRRRQERTPNHLFNNSGGTRLASSSGSGTNSGGMVTLAKPNKPAPLMKKLLQMRKSKFGARR
ncbi:hypothetical protein BLOT_007996 [Blomia tropicalis]|nr:hypothetical protein BLOT_007996 [Blomia tropicalis]